MVVSSVPVDGLPVDVSHHGVDGKDAGLGRRPVFTRQNRQVAALVGRPRTLRRMANGDGGELRLAELVAAFSLGTDLGLGQPMEHVLRSWRIAAGLGERIGLDDSERASLYYVALLAWVGCVADSHEVATWFGDDIAFRSDGYEVDLAGLPMLGYLLRHAGAGSPALHRLRLASTLVATRGQAVRRGLMSHCVSTAHLAERFGLGPDVCEPLKQMFARWDGKGVPTGVRGDRIALSIRLFHVADVVEVHHNQHGIDAALEIARERRGAQFDPDIVDELCRHAHDLLPGTDEEIDWIALIDAEPGLRARLTEPEIDNALEAVADFTDLRSPYFAGHSRGVADLAAAAAREVGLPEPDVVLTRRAGLLHDIGGHGIPATILDKPGPLTIAERERVRLHPYYTERMLARPAMLAQLGTIAASHHERLDNSGYHRAHGGAAIPMPARLIAAADAYHAMTEPRAYRPAMTADQAAKTLRSETTAGRLDGEAADAVLAAAGHKRRKRRSGPAGLTPREVEVLTLIARGASNRQVAHALHITPKTAGTHIERIYTKIGASTRSVATLFAVQHGLLDPTLADE
jgi:HD-GYP domain-containing protein (c-di-GMP phosphodiesterase class II)